MTAPTRFRKKPVEIEAVQWNGGLTSNHDAPAHCATTIIAWVIASGGTARFVNEGEDHSLRYADELYRHRVVKGDRAVAKNAPAFIVIETLEGPHRANPGDWIIRGVAGEFYPCKPDIFEQTYTTILTPVQATPTTPLQQLDDAVHDFLAYTSIEGTAVTGWVLGVETSRLDGSDPDLLPLRPGVAYALGPQTSVIAALGLARYLQVTIEHAVVDAND